MKEMHGRVCELIGAFSNNTKRKNYTIVKKNAVEWKYRFLLFGQFNMMILVCKKEKPKYPQQNTVAFIYQS